MFNQTDFIRKILELFFEQKIIHLALELMATIPGLLGDWKEQIQSAWPN